MIQIRICLSEMRNAVTQHILYVRRDRWRNLEKNVAVSLSAPAEKLDPAHGQEGYTHTLLAVLNHAFASHLPPQHHHQFRYIYRRLSACGVRA